MPPPPLPLLLALASGCGDPAIPARHLLSFLPARIGEFGYLETLTNTVETAHGAHPMQVDGYPA